MVEPEVEKKAISDNEMPDQYADAPIRRPRKLTDKRTDKPQLPDGKSET